MIQGEGAVYRPAECLQAEAGFTVTFPNKASSSSTSVLDIDNAKAHHISVPEIFRLSTST